MANGNRAVYRDALAVGVVLCEDPTNCSVVTKDPRCSSKKGSCNRLWPEVSDALGDQGDSAPPVLIRPRLLRLPPADSRTRRFGVGDFDAKYHRLILRSYKRHRFYWISRVNRFVGRPAGKEISSFATTAIAVVSCCAYGCEKGIPSTRAKTCTV
jgi:hypothetical protein